MQRRRAHAHLRAASSCQVIRLIDPGAIELGAEEGVVRCFHPDTFHLTEVPGVGRIEAMITRQIADLSLVSMKPVPPYINRV